MNITLNLSDLENEGRVLITKRKVNSDRKVTPFSLSTAEFISLSRDTLNNAGIDGDVEITRLTDHIGSKLGGSRQPFAIKTNKGVFVMKTYTHDDDLEREVLTKLDGFHSPKPFYLGEKMILEEFVYPERNLLKVFLEDKEEAIKIGAKTKALLFSKGATFYTDRNWLTDIVLSEGEWKCVDLGHARPFYSQKEDEDVDRAFSLVSEEGDLFYLKDCAGAAFLKPYPGFPNYRLHKNALSQLLNLNLNNIEKKVNAYFSIRYALYGLRDFLLDDYRGNHHDKAFREVETLAPHFTYHFAKTLNSLRN